MSKIYRSPLFYVGDKFKLIPEIKKYFPSKIDTFIEPFVGGGSVFMNIKANNYLLNDIDSNIIDLHKFLEKQSKDSNAFFNNVEQIINKYELSYSYKRNDFSLELKQEFKKTYIAKYNKNNYIKLRKDYNKSDKKDVLYLYLLLIYGFNRMLRFNSKGEFNLPVGNVDFNFNVVLALNQYFNNIKEKKINWQNLDFQLFLNNIDFGKNDFVYFDPPYLITFSEYNKIWNEENEKNLTNYLDELNRKNIKFAVSNVISYKNKENLIFKNWAEKYNIYTIKSNYISYHDNSIKDFQEVLVLNYESEIIIDNQIKLDLENE